MTSAADGNVVDVAWLNTSNEMAALIGNNQIYKVEVGQPKSPLYNAGGNIQGMDMRLAQGTPVPTATASFTPSVTPTEETPLSTWHVSCSLDQVSANARNFPSRDGQLIRTYPPGTVLFVFEERRDRDGVRWLRITGYEAYNGRETLWIREFDLSDNIVMEQGEPITCAEATPIPPTAVTPYPTATRTFPLVAPGCMPPNDCPLTTGTPTDVEIVAFVLACEAGGGQTAESQLDALNIAYAIRNRMNSGLFRGTAVQVIQQSGQWQCYGQGSTPGNGLASLNNIHPAIVDLARRLVNNEPLPVAPSDFRIRWYGLYTYGIGPYTGSNPEPDDLVADTIVANLQNVCNITESEIYINRSPFGNRDFTTAFLSDDPRCQ